MDIHITEIETGLRLSFSMLPERIRETGDALFQTYEFINVGEVQIPKGVNLLTFSWKGTLPGRSRLGASFIKAHYWQSPAEIRNLWKKWRDDETRLRLMVTETPINYDVFLKYYTAEPFGGNGDYEYSLEFIEAKPVEIYTVNELNIKSATLLANSGKTRPPSAKAAAKTHTVKSGDTLWKIAQSYLGKGNRYMEIYNLNKDKIKNPSLIYPGQVFTLPS